MDVRKTLFPYFLFSILLTFASAGSAWAETVGVPVGLDHSTQVGYVDSNGTITFYIPLASSGTYGVNGKGLSADYCSLPGNCGTGTLDMLLRFAPTPGTGILNLSFTDLDLYGVNDPSYFLESVRIYDATSHVQFTSVTVASANYSNQLLQVPVTLGNNAFIAQLTFNSGMLPGAPYGTYMNTPESLRATITATPETATLSLLGIGLLALTVIARRWKDAGAVQGIGLAK